MTDSSQHSLGDKIIRVRKLSQTNLARYSQLDPSHCKEFYLFHKDQFCGVRFSLGPFQAHWRIDRDNIQFFREDNQIGEVNLDAPSVQRAA